MTDEHIQLEYFKKSYFAVDGLWFVKVEEEWDFDTALEIDRRVWEVLPKIQARRLKELMKVESGLEDLRRVLEVKFSAEGYKYKIKTGNILEARIIHCPWLEIMEKSGRSHLAGQVGEIICNTELSVWAKEFECTMTPGLKKCAGNGECTFAFKH
jgi:hypothetical protein